MLSLKHSAHHSNLKSQWQTPQLSLRQVCEYAGKSFITCGRLADLLNPTHHAQVAMISFGGFPLAA
jgi:hypothetical protein